LEGVVARIFIFLGFCCLAITSGYASTLEVPEAKRRSYAMKFHEAFILQSSGLSTKAFYLFKDAYNEAIAAGESPLKVYLMDDLFRWYRTHGSWMGLFGREPTGNDRIVSSPFKYCAGAISQGFSDSPLANIPNYYSSEWGKTPEQAGHIRMFMFGVAQTISGIFLITCGGPVLAAAGPGVIGAGIGCMFVGLNSAYTDYERACLDLKAIEEKAKQVGSCN